MHPILTFAGQYGPGIASWLFGRRHDLGEAAAARISPAVEAAVSDNTAAIDRIGAALVAQRDGQTEILGVLHVHAERLDGIDTAINGIGASTDGLLRSAGLLSSMSMVGLGLTALSQVHLAWQFAALTRRINAIAADVKTVIEMLRQNHRTQLDNGIDDLRKAGEIAPTDPATGQSFTINARQLLTASRISYGTQLSEELSKQLSKPQAGGSAHLWVLARHLTVAALGETACFLRLGHPTPGCKVLHEALGVLRRHAAAVFARTVGSDPAHYLMRATAGHGLTLDAMAELFRQARHAGAVDRLNGVSAAELFEELRDRLEGAGNPTFGLKRKVQQCLVEFAEARAAVEEVNRVQGMKLLIEQCSRSGQSYLDLSDQIVAGVAARGPEEGSCHAVFPDLTPAAPVAPARV